MSVAKAQAALHGRRLAWTASLRPSLALLPAPLFRVLVWIKADGSTLRCRDRSALAHEPRLTGKMISEISSLSCNDLQGLRMPTVLCYVLCLTFVSGFESHSLRQF